MNTSILTATIIFIKDTERFEFFFFQEFRFVTTRNFALRSYIFHLTYCLQMISKVSFLYCIVLYIYLFLF